MPDAKLNIEVNGRLVQTPYRVVNGVWMVPAALFKHAGAEVDWPESGSPVTIRLRSKALSVPPDLSGSAVHEPEGLYVPVLDAARQLGMTVSVNPKHRHVSLWLPPGTPSCNPDVVYDKRTPELVAALTFDDGPDGYSTPRILKSLRDKGVRATFFVVGDQIRRFPDMLKRIADEGHEIGNHTWSHPDIAKLSASRLRQQIERTEAEIVKITVKPSVLFRPPYGSYTEADACQINGMGERVILWSVDTNDWRGLPTGHIVETVHRGIAPGAIVLQHSLPPQSGDLRGTIDAVPKIIDDLRRRGYKLETVSELLK